MAVLYVTEFSELGSRNQNNTTLQVIAQPTLIEQTVAIGGASVQSSAFNINTRMVQLHTDAICSVKFGTNPTATATTMRMAAGERLNFSIPVAQSYKVAVITNT